MECVGWGGSGFFSRLRFYVRVSSRSNIPAKTPFSAPDCRARGTGTMVVLVNTSTSWDIHAAVTPVAAFASDSRGTGSVTACATIPSGSAAAAGAPCGP